MLNHKTINFLKYQFMRIIKTLFIHSSLLLIAAVGTAQNAAAPSANTVSSPTNMLAILMVIIALVLAFVIYAMGQVLITLTRQVLEKNKINKAVTVLAVLGLCLLNLNVKAQDLGAETAVKVAPNYGGLTATSFWLLVAVVAIEVVAITVILILINRMKQELMPATVAKPSVDFRAWWSRVDKKLFTRAVAVEQEADILLDHEYDGIRELDNSLPPWWKYGFIITICISVIYLLHFHVLGSGKNPTEEYEAELQKAKVEMQAYEAKNKDKVDENNIQLADATGLAEGREIFQQMCWACHGKLGEGGAGPNLTDDYWLHKGSLNDIYHTIKTGYPDKGMQSWEKQYSPKQISHIASYIKSLKGSNPPNGKAPQGDLFTEEAAVADSASTAATKVESTKK
jgi:cytochrome c oxidase cbb3-type subunit 3